MPYIYKYPHHAVTTDCVILTFHEDHLKVLLIRRGIEPYKGYWALPGGFLKMDESAEEGALRELFEETGVKATKIKQFYTFSAPGRDPRERVISIAFYSLMKWQQAVGADDAEYADWIVIDRLPPLAFDHDIIIREALNAIRRDIFFEPVGFELLNNIFSMPELQKVYESILGREFDRRNFAKKMKHLDILDEVSDNQALGFCGPVSEPRIMTAGPTEYDCCMDTSESALPKFLQDDHDLCMSDESPIGSAPKRSTPRKRRPSLFFSFNRMKYNKLKDDNTLEF